MMEFFDGWQILMHVQRQSFYKAMYRLEIELWMPKIPTKMSIATKRKRPQREEHKTEMDTVINCRKPDLGFPV